MVDTPPVRPRFCCDDHCGRLARWLRTLGFDCNHDQMKDDARLLAIALREDRIIISRNRRLRDEVLARRLILLESSDPIGQLMEVMYGTGAEVVEEAVFSRCTVCNCPIEPTPLVAVEEKVPPYVRRTQTAFRVCRGCGRVYWRGTHVQRMLERLTAAGIVGH